MRMSFDWAEFLTLAEALQSAPESPGPRVAALRTAASRAYYAAFHYAVDLALGEGFQPTFRGDDHKGIQKHFRDYKPTDPLRRKISIDLNKLWNHRREADYDSNLTRQPNSLADQAIGMARSVLDKLDSL
jgi:uncharacterized protein (UPF0332 family)